MHLYELFDLVENARASLYHSTTLGNGMKIYFENKINAVTSHNVCPTTGPANVHSNYKAIAARKKDRTEWYSELTGNHCAQINGVSLTRSLQFAKKWNNEGVIFELDWTKLLHNYRIIQKDYYTNREEAEEFLIGPLKNLDKYTKTIWLAKPAADYLKEKIEDTVPPYNEEYIDFLQNPKIKIY